MMRSGKNRIEETEHKLSTALYSLQQAGAILAKYTLAYDNAQIDWHQTHV